MTENIIENPDAIKKDFIEGEILPSITKIDQKDEADDNVVKEIRSSYKKLIKE